MSGFNKWAFKRKIYSCIQVSVGNIYSSESPLSELLENDAIGETLSADTNSLKDSVTPQLVQNQVRF